MSTKSTNELAVSPEEIASAGAAMVQEDAAVDSLTETEDTDSGSTDATVEVDNPFWGDDVPTPEGKGTAAAAAKSDAPSTDSTITYKANGKEVTLTREEAAKKLALVDGARKAFSEKTNLQKKLEVADKERQELAKYKEAWDKLERIKSDPKRIYEAITGQRFDDMLAKEAQRKQAYNEASEEERRVMDYETRMKALEEQSKVDREDRDRKLKEAEDREFQAETKYTQTQLEREFFRYQFPEDKPAVANQLKRMLWRSSVADLKDRNKEGVEITPEVIKQAFRDNAKALQSFYKDEVTKGVKEVTDKKKKDATEKAQLASTRNYEPQDLKSLAGKDPMSLFRAFQRGGK